jgi:hypothetical protein
MQHLFVFFCSCALLLFAEAAVYSIGVIPRLDHVKGVQKSSVGSFDLRSRNDRGHYTAKCGLSAGRAHDDLMMMMIMTSA